MNPQNLSKTLPFSLDTAVLLAPLEKDHRLTLVNVGNVTAKAFLMGRIAERGGFKNLFWASSEDSAEDILSALELFYEGGVHLVREGISLKEYYKVLEALESEQESLLVLENFEATKEHKFPTTQEIAAQSVVLEIGKSLKIFELFGQLEHMGYNPAEDDRLNGGEFLRKGENLFVFPINRDVCVRIELNGDKVENISTYPQAEEDQETPPPENLKKLTLFPAEVEEPTGTLMDLVQQAEAPLFVSDDLDTEVCPNGNFAKVRFTTFPQEDEEFFHMNFFSVLPFYTILDFITDVKDRFHREFSLVVMTKKLDEVEHLFKENEIMHTQDASDVPPSTVLVIPVAEDEFLPHSFQNSSRKIALLTDREIFQFKRSSRRRKAIRGMNLDLISSLKPKDYVIHLDHGVAQFDGIIRRDLGEGFGVREYLKLCYAENDKLFVPVESAEKVSKFIGNEKPKLMRLGSSEWKSTQVKAKKEAERIAKDLLKLYAQREMAKGSAFRADDAMMEDFYAGFPYELTPGQATSWADVRMDMEQPQPMDRLVCGDVGFGKTEIAMRAAFKAFRSEVQCAFLSPITILAEQHYQSFLKRIEGKNYGIRVVLLSRFQTAAEQKKILKDIKHGLVDVVIGTHRLLSEDMKFKNLGLLIIDEEQRFGVKQKEKLKGMRVGVDVLTMTATPIPRTLNMSLNKLKDISTITTPPPGRLPVVTEVRKYNLNLVRERILLEVKRGGQVYFLHNKVQTIESQAEQMRKLMPEVKFLVAHGQLNPHDLEDRIRQFKEGRADVLVASTIIENGIDLPQANTLFVNNAGRFGLSQLYQLRGRVGRSRTQAYAYFLYHGQRLELEAKKRLRAIVEASELGSGFQIAMKDLEIRGAGEVLGANQSGAIKDVGVSHFIRMLNKTIEEIKSGETSVEVEEEENITVEIPLSAYIPPAYIPTADEKIQVYQELASAENPEQLEDIKRDLREDYGTLPREVENLCKVICMKMALREANLSAVQVHKSSHRVHEIVLRMGNKFSPDQVFELLKSSKNDWTITATALKLRMKILPVNWYEDLLKEVKYLIPKKKAGKKKEKKT